MKYWLLGTLLMLIAWLGLLGCLAQQPVAAGGVIASTTTWWDASTLHGVETSPIGPFRWLQPTSRLTPGGAGSSQALLLTMMMTGLQEPELELRPTFLSVSIARAPYAPLAVRIPTQWRQVRLLLPPPSAGWQEPTIELRAPAQIRDRRELGVALRAYSLQGIGLRPLALIETAIFWLMLCGPLGLALALAWRRPRWWALPLPALLLAGLVLSQQDIGPLLWRWHLPAVAALTTLAHVAIRRAWRPAGSDQA